MTAQIFRDEFPFQQFDLIQIPFTPKGVVKQNQHMVDELDKIDILHDMS
jgi:hypothetical protein